MDKYIPYIVLALVFYPMLGGLVGYIIGKKSKKVRDIFVNVVTVSEFALILATTIGLIVPILSFAKSVDIINPSALLVGESLSELGLGANFANICGMGIHFSIDGFRLIYGLIVAFMWMMVNLLCPEYFKKYRNRNRFYLFLLLTEGATMGVFLSADFYTTFIFFEIMSLTSYVWVAHDEKKDSMRAAATYLGISVLGGLVMLMGIFMLYDTLRTVTFSEIATQIIYLGYAGDKMSGELIAAGICILFGFAVKAGAFPVHIWLPKAHPVAPAPASALLSGVLTKTGIFGITLVTLQIFGTIPVFGKIFVVVSVATMLIGALMAIFSTNLKKVLACSSLSQIGFILTGVSVLSMSHGHSALAGRGALIYMVNHSLLKLVLFMAAGVIFMNLHKLELNDIQGFGRKKPLLHAAFLAGVLGISGIPFFNGYVGKTLIHEAIVEVEGVPGFVEPCFLLAGGFTLAYMLKLYVCIFIEKNNSDEKQKEFDEKKNYWTLPSKIALVGSAILLPIIGAVPSITADKIMDFGQLFFGIAEGEKIHYFALHNMKGSLISIVIGLCLYFVVVRFVLKDKDAYGKDVYVDYWPKWLDLENMVYRPVLLQFIPFISGVVCRVLDCLVDTFVVLLRKSIYRDRKLPHELPEGNVLTHYVAFILNFFCILLNHSFCRKKPIRVNMDHKVALKYNEFAENNEIIGRSLSYGLLLFCIGLVLTAGYLLFVVFFKIF